MTPTDILAQLLRNAGIPAEALDYANLTGAEPVAPSSFRVGTAAQSSIAAAALAACELGHQRGAPRQHVAVDMAHAASECSGWFSLDGQVPDPWDKFSGLYRCADGHVRIHANFAHHREGALRLLGLDPATACRADAEAAMQGWNALDFEDAAARSQLVASALRSFSEWDATPQGRALAAQPLFTIERMDAPDPAPPLRLPALSAGDRPLSGLRILDFTRILAGPVGGRALAAYGADVMLVNAPHLPNIESIADTSRGKLSTLLDLRAGADHAALTRLVQSAHVFVQGYRPGGLDALGAGPQALARVRPGLVYVSLTAYGARGPWAERRGFDSLVQTCTGFNHAEGEAAGDGRPRALPMQILDQATGYLIALCAAAAVLRQQREGGSWHVQVSLAQTAHWLRSLGRVSGGLSCAPADMAPYLETVDSGFGTLCAIRHSAQLSRTPARWTRPSMPPGSHPPVWPATS